MQWLAATGMVGAAAKAASCSDGLESEPGSQPALPLLASQDEGAEDLNDTNDGPEELNEDLLDDEEEEDDEKSWKRRNNEDD